MTVPPRALLRVKKVWIMPMVLSGVLIALISLIYVGSVVNPTGHLHGLPVLIVNEDKPVAIGGQSVDLGAKVAAGLTGSDKVTDRLALTTLSLTAAKDRMDSGRAYATIVIPADFSASTASLYGLSTASSGAGVPTITILTNQRAGSLGTSLATGVADPALSSISHSISSQFAGQAPAGSSPVNVATTQLRADPITVVTQTYRPLPDHSALGLSAFYIALLTLMCGFLGGTLVNSAIDSATGFAPTELGPRFRLRRPLPMTRWDTLRTKWIVVVVVAPLLVGLVLLVGVGALRVYAPNVLYLWLFSSFAAIVVGMGTLVFFAAFGSLGQLLAMLVFLYLSLASSGGTIPIEALPRPFRWAADVEPLRQILGGDRSIMYFNLRADSGLARGLILTGVGLVIWAVAGFLITHFYDKRGMARISPEALAFVNRSLEQLHLEKQAAAATSPATTGDSTVT
jgi:YhgE/Pip-like protein